MRRLFLITGMLAVAAGTGIVPAAAEPSPATNRAAGYDSHGRRDPLWPLVSPSGSILSYETEFQVTDMNLEGIISGAGGQNLAIINGQIVQGNDRLGPFTVTRIEKDSVVLRKDQQIFELKLKKEE